MTDVETRLRDALGARADLVRGDPAAYAAITRRRTRRTRERWATLAAGATATAALVAVAVVAGTARVDPAARPAPRPAVAITVAIDGTAVLRDGATFAPIAEYAERRPRLVKDAVSAGDGKTFYLAVWNDGDETPCTSSVLRLTLSRVDGWWQTATEPVPGLADLPVYVHSLALSPDGARLAYVARTRAPGTTRCANSGEVRVRDLATGAERAWSDGRGHVASTPPFLISDMTWSGDNRLLGLGPEYEVLDTTAPGDAVVEDHAMRVQVGPGSCTVRDRDVLPSGELAETVVCPQETGQVSGVYVVDDAARVARRLLFEFPGDVTLGRGVDFDASGDHAFLLALRPTGGDYRVQVRTWNATDGFRDTVTGSFLHADW